MPSFAASSAFKKVDYYLKFDAPSLTDNETNNRKFK